MPIGGLAICSKHRVTRDVQRAADGNDREGDDRGHQREVGGELEDEAICVVGDEVFFEEELDAVGQGLQQTEGTPALGSDAALHVRDRLALEPDHHRDRTHQRGPADDESDEHDEDVDAAYVAVHEERVDRGEEVHDVANFNWVITLGGVVELRRRGASLPSSSRLAKTTSIVPRGMSSLTATVRVRVPRAR